MLNQQGMFKVQGVLKPQATSRPWNQRKTDCFPGRCAQKIQAKFQRKFCPKYSYEITSFYLQLIFCLWKSPKKFDYFGKLHVLELLKNL